MSIYSCIEELANLSGAGKSVLAASIVKKLREEEEDGDHLLLIYFFRELNPNTVSPLAMICSLIAQILASGIDQRRVLKILKRQMDKESYYGDIDQREKLNENADSLGFEMKKMCGIFSEIARGFPRTLYIVLDGLDECSIPNLVSKHFIGGLEDAKLLRNPASTGPGEEMHEPPKPREYTEKESPTRLLLTGRPVVAHHFKNTPGFMTINMDTRKDISRLVEEEVKTHPVLSGEEAAVVKTIFQKSDGMFRYAGKRDPKPPIWRK